MTKVDCCREPDYEALVTVILTDPEEVVDPTGRIVREYRRIEQAYCRHCLTVRSFIVAPPQPRLDVVRIVDPNHLPDL